LSRLRFCIAAVAITAGTVILGIVLASVLGDWMPYFVGGVIVAAMSVVCTWAVQGRRKLFAAAARELGLKLPPLVAEYVNTFGCLASGTERSGTRELMSGTYRGIDVVVLELGSSSQVPRDFAPLAQSVVLIGWGSAANPWGEGFGLVLHPKRLIAGSNFGMESVEIEDQAFASAFKVWSTQPDEARRLLNEEVVSYCVDNKTWRIEITDAGVAVLDGQRWSPDRFAGRFRGAFDAGMAFLKVLQQNMARCAG